MTQAEELLKGWKTTRVLTDKGYDSNAVLANVAALKAEAVIPPKANRLIQRVYDKEFYKERHLYQRTHGFLCTSGYMGSYDGVFFQ